MGGRMNTENGGGDVREVRFEKLNSAVDAIEISPTKLSDLVSELESGEGRGVTGEEKKPNLDRSCFAKSYHNAPEILCSLNDRLLKLTDSLREMLI
jgi:hypothetical protein